MGFLSPRRGRRPTAPTNAARAAEVLARLDTACALLVTRPGVAGSYTLSVTVQGGILQQTWLAAGGLSLADVPPDPAAGDLAAAIARGEHGAANRDAYAAARRALVEVLDWLTQPGAGYHGTMTAVLAGEGGVIRPPLKAETNRKWKWDW
jgi:hypothetical protein